MRILSIPLLLSAPLLVLQQHVLVSAQPTIQLVQVGRNADEGSMDPIDKPTGLVSSRDGTKRMFLIEQCGKIRILRYGNLLPQTFLDLSDEVRCRRNGGGNEEGLLGLAFHPNHRENKYFYVNFSARDKNKRISVIRRYSVSAEDNSKADPTSSFPILEFSQPYSNHNGGDLAFGPDGYLYVATGDGGSGGDPDNNSQNKGNLLGKILRINVDDPSNKYSIPATNPFVSENSARSEIWSYGIRNPWRMSFDMETGDLIFGDVGQNEFEEVNFQPAASKGGENYGWRMMEGRNCYNPSSGCRTSNPPLTLPILTYPTGRDCSVIGGYRYRGKEMPDLVGKYIYGDYCSGTIWVATENPNSGTWTSEELLRTNMRISSFGENQKGELYVVNHSGSVHKMTTRSTNCEDREEFTFSDNPTKTCAWLLRRGKRKRRKLCRRQLADGTKARNICPRACKALCQ